MEKGEGQPASTAPAVPEIVSFWRSCPLSEPPFVHPQDLSTLRHHSADLLGLPPTNLDQFVTSPRFGNADDRGFHFSLLPAPYMGNLSRADILLLLLNPGLNVADYHAEWNVPEFRRRLARNLYQDLDGLEFPFLLLDPEFCWHPGFRWWERKLRNVATILAKTRYPGRYRDALCELSNRIAALELVPYHSSAFNGGKIVDDLPSALCAKGHALTYVQKRASSGLALVVAMRNVSAWGLPDQPGLVSYPPPLSRGASLGSNTPGGKAILARLGLEP
jgi:hypothetical protein